VTEADIKRLPKRAQQLVVHGGSAYERFFYTVQGLYGPLTALATKQTAITRGPLKRVEATVCACLSGNPLDRVACDVYEQRPEICRTAVKPGDRTCRVIRRELFALIDDNQSK
jgi:Fe-S-cluster containining protein